MNKIIYLLIILSLSSCTLTKLQRQSNRVARKIERLERKFPEAFEITNTETLRIDTVIQRVEIKGEATSDTIEVDRIVKEFVTDSIQVIKYRTKIIEAAIPVVGLDSLGVKLRIGPSPSGLFYSLEQDPIHIQAEKKIDRITTTKTEVVRRPFWKDWKFWILVVLFVLYQIFKTTIKIYLKSMFK